MIRRRAVEHGARGPAAGPQLRGGEARLVPPAPQDPLARRRGGRGGADAALDLGHAGDAGEVDVQQRAAARRQVHVRVVEAGRHEAPVQVDHPRRFADDALHLVVVAGDDDVAAAHGDGLHGGAGAVAHEDLAVQQHQVGRGAGRHGGLRGERGRGRERAGGRGEESVQPHRDEMASGNRG